MNVGITPKKEKKRSPSSKFEKIVPLLKKDFEEEKQPIKKVIMIAGPTACGKSSLSLLLAEAIGGEIVSADSMQVYKGMDIGTAKVSQEDQARVPHHLIDIRHIQESFNVVDYFYEAKQCCESICARDKVPIVTGGSGFYFRALLHGPPGGPPSIPDVRTQLEDQLLKFGSTFLYERLLKEDPIYARSITPNDKHKIVRALEIVTLTGKKVSDQQWRRDQVIPDFKFYCWFLYRPREALYPRIDHRCDQMLDAGLIDEVKLLDKQGLRQNRSASQAIGYRQVLDFLESPQTKSDYEKLVREFKTASRHYAKRQFTWFRKEPLFRWLNIEMHDMEIAVEMILRDFSSS